MPHGGVCALLGRCFGGPSDALFWGSAMASVVDLLGDLARAAARGAVLAGGGLLAARPSLPQIEPFDADVRRYLQGNPTGFPQAPRDSQGRPIEGMQRRRYERCCAYVGQLEAAGQLPPEWRAFFEACAVNLWVVPPMSSCGE